MTKIATDSQGRRRNTTVSFRVSAEEAELLDSLVAMSGKTKQEYIMSCLENHHVTVIPNSRVHKALYDEMGQIYRELRRIRKGSDMNPELEAVINRLAQEYTEMGEEPSDTEKEDALIHDMRRE